MQLRVKPRATSSHWYDLDQLELSGIKVVTTDVFDTLLLRTARSERARLVDAERRFSRYLAAQGYPVDWPTLLRMRREAQRVAYRACDVGASGEVREVDIISRQLQLLDLPQSFGAYRLRLTVEIEKRSLIPNFELAKRLREFKAKGLRVVAISDTALPAASVKELIDHFLGVALVDAIYSSADQGKTKRRGEIFAPVAQNENVAFHQMLHVGDDALADDMIPSRLGLRTLRVPRSQAHNYARFANAAGTEVKSAVGNKWQRLIMTKKPHTDAVSFGHEVLGPIAAQFCQQIWLYAEEARRNEECVLLFCARGGIGIREAFERFLSARRLPMQVRRQNFFVSRLLAARAAVAARSDAALQELGREFSQSTYLEVAEALGGGSYQLEGEWTRPFDAAQFYRLLSGDDAAIVRADIDHQNALFKRHLHEITQGAKRIILCDTGLYGSTQRLLGAACPDLSIETIQFARANYKRHSEAHFPRVSGLVVEQNLYSPLRAETCILRYWHLIESLFEPGIPSVKTLHLGEDDCVRANSGPIEFGALDPAAGNMLLTGALAYIDALATRDRMSIVADLDKAWRSLKQTITRPTAADISFLAVHARSVDFGRAGSVSTLRDVSQGDYHGRMQSVRSALWREAAVVREFPVLSPLLLTMIELAHAVRPMVRVQADVR